MEEDEPTEKKSLPEWVQLEYLVRLFSVPLQGIITPSSISIPTTRSASKL